MSEAWDRWSDEPVARPRRHVDPQSLPAALWRASWQQHFAALEGHDLAAARDRGFAMTTAALAEAGVARHDARRMVRRGEWTGLGRGVVAPIDIRGDDEHLVRRRLAALQASGAVLLRADHVISASSGAIAHGLPTMSVPPSPQMTAPDQRTLGNRAGRHIYGAGLPPDAVTSWFGAPITTVARTVVDQARHSRRDGIIAVDAALREQLVTAADLEHALDGAAGWPGVKQAREIVALGDGRAESPLESITRLALHDDGFPPAIPQVYLGGYWTDLLIPDLRLVIECDGRGKYVGDALDREKLRQHRIGRLRYAVERVMWEDVVRYWTQTRRRLWAASYGH